MNSVHGSDASIIAELFDKQEKCNNNTKITIKRTGKTKINGKTI